MAVDAGIRPRIYKLSDIPKSGAVPCSVDTLRKAIKQTDPEAFPPPLKAKVNGRGEYYILAKDLDDWLERWPDA